MPPKPVQGSLFEEDYLLRTLGSIAHVPDIALTELVANAWDAGAMSVQITIPDEPGQELLISDDGTGMTLAQFKKRWMTLGYDRVKHQGGFVEFPPDRDGPKRRAYGHNGVGRHGMLCFASQYRIETSSNGEHHRFEVSATGGREPFVLTSADTIRRRVKHGTTLRTVVARNLPRPERIAEILASRFLYDPEFSVDVNGIDVPMTNLSGFVEQRTLKVGDCKVEAICFDAEHTAKTTHQHGVAFWVAGRLVGSPSWIIDHRPLLDGRLRAAKRLTIVVKTGSEFVDEVEADWTRFKDGDLVQTLLSVVTDYVLDVTRRVMADHVEETQAAVLSEHRSALDKLAPSGRVEVAEFAEEVVRASPTIPQEMLSIAVRAVIRLEESRSGLALLTKLAQLDSQDVDGLNVLLERWSVRDALTVLDEIERRVSVIEALEKLCADEHVDELRTLHPLVTNCRWLFGPEFESPMYVSNVSIQRAVSETFQRIVAAEQFVNPKKRPDLVFLPDSTLSAVGVEEMQQGSALVQLRRILLLELKRGRSKIGREEMTQAGDYVEDFLHSAHLRGGPQVSAFVVGHTVDPRIATTRTVGNDGDQRGRVDACTFDQLTRTANLRLFALRSRVAERYEGLSGVALSEHLHDRQQQLFSDSSCDSVVQRL